jgi:hypothetical protein
MMELINTLRFERHDPHQETGQEQDPLTKHWVSRTRLDDAKHYGLIRMDIFMVNYKDDYGQSQQECIFPYQDGTYYRIPTTIEQWVTLADLKWMAEEARKVAETCKAYPDIAKHVSKGGR